METAISLKFIIFLPLKTNGPHIKVVENEPYNLTHQLNWVSGSVLMLEDLPYLLLPATGMYSPFPIQNRVKHLGKPLETLGNKHFCPSGNFIASSRLFPCFKAH